MKIIDKLTCPANYDCNKCKYFDHNSKWLPKCFLEYTIEINIKHSITYFVRQRKINDRTFILCGDYISI